MRAHIVDGNGLIINTASVDALSEGEFDADILGGSKGDSIVDGVLVPYAEARESVIARRWEEIKADRDRRVQRGYRAAGHWFHGDVFSRTQQIGLVMMGASIPPGLQWKTIDDGFVTMTQSLAAQVFAAAAASDQTHFAHAEALHAQLQAADDPASVDISAGWPEEAP